MDKSKRPNITTQCITHATNSVMEKLYRRLNEKGYGSFASKHEVLGILQEEMHELTEAIYAQFRHEVIDELEDVAVGAIFALACLRQDTLDW